MRDPQSLGYYHCSRCQRWTGSSLAGVVVAKENFAVAGQVAWVPDYPTDQLLKVNTATGETVPVTVGSGPDAVAVGDHAVWVANAGDGTVSEVSPSAGKLVASPIYVGNGPSGIVAAEHAVWVTLSVDGAVAKIDASSGRVADTFSAGNDPTRIVFGFRTLWVTNESTGTVTPIDPTTDSAGSPISVGGGPNGIAVGAGGGFVTNSLDGTVSRIDPNTQRIVWTKSQYAGTLAWAAADRRFTDYLWVMPVATPIFLGFVAKRVGNYLYAPAPGNDPQIDQMWVR